MATAFRADGAVGAHRVSFIPVHREGKDTPEAVRLAVSVPMSLDDLTAAAWILVDGGYPFDALSGPDFPELVLETVFAEGGFRIDEVREELATVSPASMQGQVLALLRQRVRELLDAVCAPRQPQRELVAVGA